MSHSLWAVRRHCPRAIVINQGHVEYDGPTERAIAKHLALLAPSAGDQGDSVIVDQELVTRDGSGHHAGFDEPVTLRFPCAGEDGS